MDKNRIQGRARCGEWAQHHEAAGPVAEVNAAVVPGSNALLPGEIPRRKCLGKSADAIVPSGEPGAERRPCKHDHRKTRRREGLNRSAGIRPRNGHSCQ